MRIVMPVSLAAALLAVSATAGLAEGPYDNSSSYWAKVERWQDCAWKRQESPYPPAFAYGPAQTCNYGPPAARYYAPPPATPWTYGYSAYGPYYYR